MSLLGVGVGAVAVKIDTQGLALMHKRLSYGNHWHSGLLSSFGRDIRMAQTDNVFDQTTVNPSKSQDTYNSTLTKETFSFSNPQSNLSASLRKKKMIRYVKSRSSQAVKRRARRVLKRKLKINRKSMANVDMLSNMSHPQQGPTNIIDNLNR